MALGDVGLVMYVGVVPESPVADDTTGVQCAALLHHSKLCSSVAGGAL